MDSNIQSPPLDGADAKTAFRKPSNDAASRKYRRHSPASRSSSSDGSPRRDRSSSPNDGKKDPEKVSDNRHRRYEERREVDRDSGRNQYSRSSDSYRQSDRQSSRGSHGYRRHYDNRRDRYADEEERNYHKSSSRSSHDLREGSRSDKFDGEHNRSRDCIRDVDKYSRDKYDGAGHKTKEKEIEDQKYKDRDILSEKAGSGRRLTNSSYEEKIKSGARDRHVRDGDGRNEKRDHHRSIGDGKSDHMPYYEESRGHRTESASRKDSGGNRLKDTHKSDPRELDLSKYTREDKRKYKDLESGRHKDRYGRESGEYEDKAVFANEGQDSPSKKSKIFSLDKGADSGKDVLKSSTTAADDRRSPISKQDEGGVHKVTPAEANANGSEVAGDLNAAKVAAMKAAELVNRNLVGTGVLSADQKKKLLWGNKKSTTAEESGHRWDATLFPDRERQEKFNKLMGVKGDLKIEHKPENPDGSSVLLAEKQKELQLDLEKQYTAGLRRRDGRTVGLGL